MAGWESASPRSTTARRYGRSRPAAPRRRRGCRTAISSNASTARRSLQRRVDRQASRHAAQSGRFAQRHAQGQGLGIEGHVEPGGGPAGAGPLGGGPFSDRRWGFSKVIPHDLGIAPTECGGPLVDLDGHCVGVNIARALRVASYALPGERGEGDGGEVAGRPKIYITRVGMSRFGYGRRVRGANRRGNGGFRTESTARQRHTVGFGRFAQRTIQQELPCSTHPTTRCARPTLVSPHRSCYAR